MWGSEACTANSMAVSQNIKRSLRMCLAALLAGLYPVRTETRLQLGRVSMRTKKKWIKLFTKHSMSWTQLQSPGKRESKLRNCLHQTGQWACLRDTVLDNWFIGLIWEGPAHCRRCHPGHMVLATIRKGAAQATRGKPVSNALPRLLLQFLR